MSRTIKDTAARVWWRKRVPNQRLLLAVGILASAGILGSLILRHVDALLGVGARVQWRYVSAAVACAAGSYLMIGLALSEVLELLGFTLSFPEVMGIALVSTTANYFVSSVGASGFALKAHLLRKRQVPYGATVTAAVVSSAVMYMVLAVILGQGLVYLLLHLRGLKIAIMEGAFGLGVLLAVAAGFFLFLVHHELRGRLTRSLFHQINRAIYLFSKTEIPREEFDQFEAQLAEGLDRIRRSGRGLGKIVAYTCFDWGLAMMTLYFGFRAVGVALPVGHLSAGFTVGQAGVLVPILPGGIGAVEGSMAAVFESLGIGWDQAMVAVLLYRVAYYFLPGLMSVFVLWGLKISEPARLDG